MLPATGGANVRKTARYAGKDGDPLQLALPFDASLEEEILSALDLTHFATRYRYPGDPVEPDVP